MTYNYGSVSFEFIHDFFHEWQYFFHEPNMNWFTPMTKYGLTNLGMGFFIHSVFMPFHCLCFWFCQNRKKKILWKKIIFFFLLKLLQNGKQTCSKRHRPTVLIHFLATGCFQMIEKIPVCPSEAEKIFSLENLHISSIQAECSLLCTFYCCTGTLSSRRFGPTRSTMCTASCCWCSSSWPSSLSAWPLSAPISC